MQHSKWITLGFGALCLIAVATVLHAQHLFYMAAILLTLPGVSYLVGWLALQGLEFRRELPPVSWEGEEGTLYYEANNRSRFARFFLTIHERLPKWIEPIDADPPLFNVSGGEVTHVSTPVRFNKRGVFHVDSFDVVAMDPLGVFAFTRHVACEGEIVVYPSPYIVAPIPLSGSDRYGWQDFATALLHGSSVEPDGVRPYVAGDPLRRIHWRQTARTGRLSVTEFEEYQSVNLVIALDAQKGTEVGSGLETTLEYGVRMAASIAAEAIRQGASIQFACQVCGSDPQNGLSDPQLQVFGRGEAHLYALLDALARVEAISPISIGQLITDILVDPLAGTSLVIITSRIDQDLLSVVANLRTVGVSVNLVFIDPCSFDNASKADRDRISYPLLQNLEGVGIKAFVVSREQRRNEYQAADTDVDRPAVVGSR